jgi:DNA modification methylase
MAAPYYQDEHVTLYHGDCLEVREWLAADVLVTDPPYGMGYRGFAGRPGRTDGSRHGGIAGDQDCGVRDAALAAWGAGPALVFGTWKRARPSGVRQLIVWDKRGGGGYLGDVKMPWADATEEIYVIGTRWAGKRRPAIYSVPSLNSQSQSRPDHPTPKPVALMEQLLECCPAGLVADPFAGAGATLIAASRAGRTAVGVEVNERYCELIATRLGQDSLLPVGRTA